MPTVFLATVPLTGTGLETVVGLVGLGPVREAGDVEEAEQVRAEAIGGLAVGDVHLVVED
jgi:hypothetical protein